MPLYEHVFLARQDVSGQQVEALVEQFKGVIEQGGGKVTKIEPWGLKSLTYRIRKNRKAHFTLMNIDAPPAAVAEMERQQSIHEDYDTKSGECRWDKDGKGGTKAKLFAVLDGDPNDLSAKDFLVVA